MLNETSTCALSNLLSACCCRFEYEQLHKVELHFDTIVNAWRHLIIKKTISRFEKKSTCGFNCNLCLFGRFSFRNILFYILFSQNTFWDLLNVHNRKRGPMQFRLFYFKSFCLSMRCSILIYRMQINWNSVVKKDISINLQFIYIHLLVEFRCGWFVRDSPFTSHNRTKRIAHSVYNKFHYFSKINFFISLTYQFVL